MNYHRHRNLTVMLLHRIIHYRDALSFDIRSLRSNVIYTLSLVAGFCFVLLFGQHSLSEVTPPVTADLELPQPVLPADTLDVIEVPRGFRMELVAAEPLVRDPIAMEFDENGFAYLIEVPPYNEHGKPGPRSKSTIARLEDKDGDGRFDSRVTFAELRYPTGLFCYDGGLFVGDPPDLLYLRDADGDGRADERRVVLTGFGTGPAGESQLNSFRWGLDNRIHICTGFDGGQVRPVHAEHNSSTSSSRKTFAPSLVEAVSAAPNNLVAERDVRNRRILLEPRSGTFELTSGGGQYGMSFDDWGRVFVCENSLPIQTIMYDDRYIERNPLMTAPEPAVNVGPGVNYKQLHRICEAETWRRIRSRLLEEGVAVTDTYEWDRIPGVFTSATGITIYRGDAWPEGFCGNAIVGEVANNIVYRALLKADGLNIVSERAGDEPEFVASTDTWFRPVQFSHGPDGNLYVIDMYRQLIEGVQWVPPEVLARMDPTTGSDRGRIYRLVRDEYTYRRFDPLKDLPIERLVELLEHSNSWHRETAARLIYQRKDKAAVKPLRRMVCTSKFPLGRLHALYALDGLEALEEGEVLLGLNDPHPRVREHAVRLAEHFILAINGRGSEAIRRKLLSLTADPDVGVRFQLAFSLGYFPSTERDPALLELLRRDGTNAWFRMAIQSSLAVGAERFIACVLKDEALRYETQVQKFLSTLAQQVGRSQNRDDIAVVVTIIDKLEDQPGNNALAKKLTVSLLADGDGATIMQLAELSHGRVKDMVSKLLRDARQTVLDVSKSDQSRCEAINILGCGTFDLERSAFDALLEPQQPQPVQEKVLRILGRFSDVAVADLILSKWSSFTPTLRATAAEVLLSRSVWAEALLNAVESNEITRADFDPARTALLQSHPSQHLRERAASIFAAQNVTQRRDVVNEYRRALDLSGDVARGRVVFDKTCAICHALEGRGNAIGADLKGVSEHGKEAILLNILDPNREVLPQYLSYVVVANDGRVFTGMFTEETPNNLKIRQADGTDIQLLRVDIEEVKSTGLSFMPEGLERQIDQQSMADLLAYLMDAKEKSQDGQ